MKKIVIREDIVEDGEVLLKEGEIVELLGWSKKGEYMVKSLGEEPLAFVIYEDEWAEIQ